MFFTKIIHEGGPQTVFCFSLSLLLGISFIYLLLFALPDFKFQMHSFLFLSLFLFYPPCFYKANIKDTGGMVLGLGNPICGLSSNGS